MWNRYDYLCTNCDALIEVTAKAEPALDADCICGNSAVINIGSAPAHKPGSWAKAKAKDVSKVTP
jgi:uncharacterized Fe-S cluster protein YjdI